MGYTHYWSFKDETLSQTKFNKILKDVQKIEEHFKTDNILFSGNGEGKGIYYEGGLMNNVFECNGLYLNGDASKEDNHETFNFGSGVNEWNFCKTARKPYDIAVCMILLSVKYHTRSTNIKSDGDGEQSEWGQAFDLWDELFGRTVYFKFKEYVSDSKKLDGSLSCISSVKATKDLLEKGVAI